jgi:hypothetical protein
MGIFSALSDAGAALGKGGVKVLDDVKPIKSFDAPTIKPLDAPSVKPVEVKPSGGVASGVVGAGGLAVGAAGFIIPSILNSTAVSAGIGAAASVGQAAILGDVAGNVLADITGSPVNMAIVGVVAVGAVYLLFRR